MFEVRNSTHEDLQNRFLAHMLGDTEFGEIELHEINPVAKFTVELLDSLRDLTNLLNRYFASLYALSDDQSLIAFLASLAKGISSTSFSRRVFHLIVSQTRLLSSLLVIIKLKTQEDLSAMKFEVSIILDMLWNGRQL